MLDNETIEKMMVLELWAELGKCCLSKVILRMHG